MSNLFGACSRFLLLLGVLAATGPRLSAEEERRLVPLPRLAPAPADNPTTPKKVALGKQLFFDPRLSGEGTMSCATCHLPEKAYADGLARAKGVGGKTLSRNSPSCLNVGFFARLFWDGRAESLEEQALAPIESADEMNQSLAELEQELRAIPGYARQFQEVFGSPPDRDGIAKALAAFQRTLITEPSPFDRFLAGEEDALSEQAKQGLSLFRGEAGCSKCHHGPLLSDGEFHRLGVSFNDPGRADVTGKREDRFRFRTPSLRNVAETAPYMHDGSLATLDDVVTFYYRGIPDRGPDGLAPDTSALTNRSFAETLKIVPFLESLTGKAPDVRRPLLPGLVAGEHETSISPAAKTEPGWLVHRVKSPYQDGETMVRVLMPDSLDEKRRYPVVYVLPVEPHLQDRYGDGPREVQKRDLHNRHAAIFVAPTFSALPWYADHPEKPGVRQESYFLRIVVPFVEQTYPATRKPAGRLLLGFSKSGWGAWSLLLRHPGRFGRAAAWDAPLMMEKLGKYGTSGVFGMRANFDAYRPADLLRSHPERLRERSRLILIGYGGFRDHHQRMHDLLTELGVPHAYRDGPQRKHDWHSGWVAGAVELLLAD